MRESVDDGGLLDIHEARVEALEAVVEARGIARSMARLSVG